MNEVILLVGIADNYFEILNIVLLCNNIL